jgi:hypothetical protein
MGKLSDDEEESTGVSVADAGKRRRAKSWRRPSTTESKDRRLMQSQRRCLTKTTTAQVRLMQCFGMRSTRSSWPSAWTTQSRDPLNVSEALADIDAVDVPNDEGVANELPEDEGDSAELAVDELAAEPEGDKLGSAEADAVASPLAVDEAVAVPDEVANDDKLPNDEEESTELPVANAWEEEEGEELEEAADDSSRKTGG